jgi:hypothetical protein
MTLSGRLPRRAGHGASFRSGFPRRIIRPAWNSTSRARPASSRLRIGGGLRLKCESERIENGITRTPGNPIPFEHQWSFRCKETKSGYRPACGTDATYSHPIASGSSAERRYSETTRDAAEATLRPSNWHALFNGLPLAILRGTQSEHHARPGRAAGRASMKSSTINENAAGK